MLKADEIEKNLQRSNEIFDQKFQRCQEMFDRWNKAKKKIYSDGSLDDDSLDE